MILVGTGTGLVELDGNRRESWAGHDISAIASNDGTDWFALADGTTVLRRADPGSWTEVGSLPPSLLGQCLLPWGDEVVVGTSEARLVRISQGAGRAELVTGFDAIAGREDWYTPWGDPADVRSMALDIAAALYVNVHVGGVWRSTDAGESWSCCIDVEADVHQVVADTRSDVVAASAAIGVGTSDDGGRTFLWSVEGLHAPYCRAAAIAGDTLLVTASTGPSTSAGGLYRRALEGGPFERVTAGLPEWFPFNIDTFQLAADGQHAVLGTTEGDLYASEDEGATWALIAEGLPGIRCLAVTS